MAVFFSFRIRVGLEKKFVEQSAPICTTIKDFRKFVEPRGCLDNYDFYRASSPKGARTKMKQNDIFGPGNYITLIERK